MRKMTFEEFSFFLDTMMGYGLTKNEKEIYFMMFNYGRQSVRW